MNLFYQDSVPKFSRFQGQACHPSFLSRSAGKADRFMFAYSLSRYTLCFDSPWYACFLHTLRPHFLFPSERPYSVLCGLFLYLYSGFLFQSNPIRLFCFQTEDTGRICMSCFSKMMHGFPALFRSSSEFHIVYT